jgi:hypothetical protein
VNLEFSPAEVQFRAMVREFLRDQLPADIRDKVLNF